MDFAVPIQRYNTLNEVLQLSQNTNFPDLAPNQIIQYVADRP